ncbi:unnamed protein product [Rotaria sordida]|uniref:Uncharacterized protein n=1 Tax=Rotaria sordida TaxID=392033 RepID=A0A815FBE8_9BILA|nr:unnamed protein product [Rotaria sordida]
MRRVSDHCTNPLPDAILDRFCLQILPEIHHKIKWLNLESSSMERILHATNYPNLYGLGLYELHIRLMSFSGCLYILDGRFNKLHTLHVDVTNIFPSDFPNNNQEKLSIPNIRCFSLYCQDIINVYDELIVPYLQRMSNLEKLTLNLATFVKNTFVDGNELNQNIVSYMPRLRIFEFYICSNHYRPKQIYLPSKEYIQHTFRDFKNDQVSSYIDYFQEKQFSLCHIYSYPYNLKYYYTITNNFPGGLFKYVQEVSLYDERSFEHEFFLRIQKSFPFIKIVSIKNSKPQNNKLCRESKNDNQDFSIIKYPYLINLTLYDAHDDYIEEFLVDTNICLPDNSVHINIDYEQLERMTHNFTRDSTRINCAKLDSLCLNGRRLPEYAKDYFPHV